MTQHLPAGVAGGPLALARTPSPARSVPRRRGPQRRVDWPSLLTPSGTWRGRAARLSIELTGQHGVSDTTIRGWAARYTETTAERDPGWWRLEWVTLLNELSTQLGNGQFYTRDLPLLDEPLHLVAERYVRRRGGSAGDCRNAWWKGPGRSHLGSAM